ncbi:MAG TPA: roadblock/LC7 domain-containing protein [Armatimonadota bacterium]|nr:roadblock/LC7 domain-containing protein [Armatimonadota bacterium]
MTSEPTTKRQGLGGALEAVIGVPGVLAGMVATEEGLPLAARLRAELDEEALAAAATVLGQLGTKTLADIDRGELEVVVLDASKFRFVVQPVAFGYLMVVTEPRAKTDPILAEMTSTAAYLDEAASALAQPRAA